MVPEGAANPFGRHATTSPGSGTKATYKIALVCDWYLPRVGGIEHQLCDLHRQLTARGHEVHIITATPGPAAGRDTHVHRLPVSRLPGWHTVWNRRALRLLQAILARERFDVVHGHSMYSPLAHAAMYLARALGCSSVLTNHSLLGRTVPTVISTLGSLSGLSHAADLITGVSNAVVDDTKKAIGRQDVSLVPNALDMAEWYCERVGPCDMRRDMRVVSVMRLSRRKRPLELIRTIPRVYARLPQRLWPRFTIIGDGSERARAEREARRLGVSDRVDFLGFRPREEVRAILAESSIFVLPTVKEAFGIAVLEARCVGLPVVAMKHGGISDIIAHGEEGYLTTDFDEFAHRIAELVQNTTLRARMANNGAERLKRFGWDVVTEQYLDIYRLAMAKRR